MSGTRERIAAHVRAHPGVHFSGIRRALELAPGQVQYHLRVLRRDGELEAESFSGRTHYYAGDVDAWDRRALALLRRETAREVIAVLLEQGPTRPAAVADRLGIARSTLAWQVDRLTASGLVVKHRDAGNRVTLALERRDDVVRLLRGADPSLLDRLADRFTRLVDRLLAE